MNRILAWTVALILVSSGDARAQGMTMGSFKGFFTGHIGSVAGDDVSDPRMAIGASVAVHEPNGWGAELDFGHSSDAHSGAQVLDVTTYMVNGTWIAYTGRVRPFGLFGAGVMQVDGCDAPCNRPSNTYDFGLSAGAGVYAVFNDYVGVRGDARYFYSSADHPDLRRPEGFKFWRVSAGVTFMWTVLP